MSKWLYKKIRAIPTVNVCGEAYIRRDAVLELVGRTCKDCRFFVEGKKKSMSKCTNPTYNTRDGWRWTSGANNVCQKFEGGEQE